LSDMLFVLHILSGNLIKRGGQKAHHSRLEWSCIGHWCSQSYFMDRSAGHWGRKMKEDCWWQK